jgi:two-component system, OmpR family, response regulator
MNDTIMIVDDSTFIVDGLVAILKRKGYKPVPAHSGDECLELLKTSTPDLILLDIMMEPMDGWETLDKIKSNPATQGIPVLMFSAKKISPSEAQEHSMNIDDFVTKPVNPLQLMDSIQRIFNRRDDVKVEALVAQNAGLDKALIDEYTALRTSIEVDKNLLVILKHSTGANAPGRVVSPEDLASMQKLEEKIKIDEQRMREINEKFTKPAQ